MTNELQTLIAKYIESNDSASIISLIESLQADRDRLILLNAGYLHQIKRLSESFKAITEPKQPSQYVVKEPSSPARIPSPSTTKPAKVSRAIEL